jgi:hypothetical protein
VEISEETADIISMQVMKEIVNYDLETKVVGLSADNTNTDFRGLTCKENMLTKIKSQLNRNLIGFGCNAHIIHTCTKTAFDSMPLDIKVLVTKNFGYFRLYTVCVECLKDFCDFTRQEYKQILGYARWLSSFSALERILKIYPSLKSFYVRNTVPKTTETIFLKH